MNNTSEFYRKIVTKDRHNNKKTVCCNVDAAYFENKWDGWSTWKCGKCGRVALNPYLGKGDKNRFLSPEESKKISNEH